MTGRLAFTDQEKKGTHLLQQENFLQTVIKNFWKSDFHGNKCQAVWKTGSQWWGYINFSLIKMNLKNKYIIQGFKGPYWYKSTVINQVLVMGQSWLNQCYHAV